MGSLEKALVTSTIAIAVSLGIDYGKPNTVVAQEVSATWAETMTLTSILNGYESISLSLEEIGIEGKIDLRDSSIIFSETIAAVNLVGTIGDLDLILNGQGVLSGEVGSEDLSWTGNWLGSLGDEFISADDTGNFALEGTQGYTTFDFQQSGLPSFGSWNGASTAELTSELGGSSVSGGWQRFMNFTTISPSKSYSD